MGDVQPEWAIMAAEWAMIRRMGDVPNGRCSENGPGSQNGFHFYRLALYSAGYVAKTMLSTSRMCLYRDMCIYKDMCVYKRMCIYIYRDMCIYRGMGISADVGIYKSIGIYKDMCIYEGMGIERDMFRNMRPSIASNMMAI